MRKLLPFIAGISLAIAVPAAAQWMPSMRYPDFEDQAFYADDLSDLLDQGIIRGYDDGRLGPNDYVTRAQLAVIMKRYDRFAVDPLREQIRELRMHLDMGECGDDDIQRGEQCDDGNTVNGDGCSEFCFKESNDGRTCNGHRVGESYIGADGCNRCTCTENGEICTKMYCPRPNPRPGCEPYVCRDGTTHPRCDEDGGVINYFAPPCHANGGEVTGEKCFGDHQCDDGQVCSTRYGDCESSCEPGDEMCIQVCAGRCVDPRDEEFSCSEKKETFDRVAENDANWCETDDDCMIFESSCPFVTCGVAVNVEAESKMRRLANDYTTCLEDSGEPMMCASCLAMRAECNAGKCEAVTR